MKVLRNGKSVEKVEPPAVDISREAVAERARLLRRDGKCSLSADMLEALAADRDRLDKELAAEKSMLTQWSSTFADTQWRQLKETTADRDRLRTFVRSARAIIQAYATANPTHFWQVHGPYDPMGAHAWLEAESEEIGTMRDGGDPKLEGKL